MEADVRRILRKLNIRPSKSLGQNFLTDGWVLQRITEAAELTPNDTVLEIGPGIGNLTSYLAEDAGCVVAVEIDKRLAQVLHDLLIGYRNVHIINADILRLDLKKELAPFMTSPDGTPRSLKVVANLPYYITTPVIMKLLENGLDAECMVIMVQKEVAARMMAKPGGKDYGALSVSVGYYSRPTVIMDVPPDCFIPQPGVDSTVVRLDLYKTPPVELKDRDLFFKVVKAAFGQRRKTLLNALNNAGYIGADKEQIRMLLERVGIDEMQRGETLSIQQFAQLANELHDLLKQ
ncbi:MAG TPA: 16S rRNA (adenine(1518)-N(6)/adenine(1519)-N(6))-dimethyltransferase RsmA [Clostridiales bacterium]|nr:16S rRNA (adenine(1518)-N(6)/adenine(1519)-N(6))-dimethyltransferase RsmA [Clostridiales bacterium]HPV02132.1 16S rRNA (adenine(1518)-N(6)/adenine(1519)-N(6))-dimethyltransferase RsmA [Clostridiales bacterium]